MLFISFFQLLENLNKLKEQFHTESKMRLTDSFFTKASQTDCFMVAPPPKK